MSSIVNVATTSAPRNRRPARVMRTENAFGDGGAVRRHVEVEPVAVAGHDVRHRPGPGVRAGASDPRERLRRRRQARERGGERPHRRRAAPRARRAGAAAVAACRAAAAAERRRGFVRSRLTAARSIATRADRRLRDDRLAVRRLPQRGEGRQMEHRRRDRRRRAAPAPSTNATLEKRGTATARPATRCAAARLRHRTSRPRRPPIQIAPATRCSHRVRGRAHAARSAAA